MNIPPSPSCIVPRKSWRSGVALSGTRELAEEVPVAFSYDGAIHAVMMASPGDAEDFAIGFSLTEGIISAPREIAEVEIAALADGITARVWLTDKPSEAFAARRRRYVGPAGCGMCGLESIAQAIRAVPQVGSNFQTTDMDIASALAAMAGEQRLNLVTHAVHAAGFWRADAGIVVREDVGRHNALDKLAGAMAQQNIPTADGIVVMTSRISVELVQKAAMIGVPILAGVSAPTALAVRTAAACGITLVGIARDDGFEVFSEDWRVHCRAVSYVA